MPAPLYPGRPFNAYITISPPPVSPPPAAVALAVSIEERAHNTPHARPAVSPLGRASFFYSSSRPRPTSTAFFRYADLNATAHPVLPTPCVNHTPHSARSSSRRRRRGSTCICTSPHPPATATAIDAPLLQDRPNSTSSHALAPRMLRAGRSIVGVVMVGVLIAVIVNTAAASATATTTTNAVCSEPSVVARASPQAGSALEPAAAAAGEAAAAAPGRGHAVAARGHEELAVDGGVVVVVVAVVVVHEVIVAVNVGGEGRSGITSADDLRKPIQHERYFGVVWRDTGTSAHAKHGQVSEAKPNKTPTLSSGNKNQKVGGVNIAQHL